MTFTFKEGDKPVCLRSKVVYDNPKIAQEDLTLFQKSVDTHEALTIVCGLVLMVGQLEPKGL